jgi:hypothetical protein
VVIDPAALAIEEPHITRAMQRTRLAGIEIERPSGKESGGMEDYSGPLFEQLQLEQLSHSALAVVCSELAVQVHLLINGLLRSVAERYGEAAALAVGEFQMTGSSWVVSERLSEWLGCKDSGIEGILKVLQIHPAFQPAQYWRVEVTRLDDNRALFALLDCAACEEEEPYSWCALLIRGMSGGLEGLVKGVDARASIRRHDDKRLVWEIAIDEGTADEEPLSVQIAKGTVLYQTRLQDHIQLLQL